MPQGCHSKPPQAWNLQEMEICPVVTLEAKDVEKGLQSTEKVMKVIVFPISASAG